MLPIDPDPDWFDPDLAELEDLSNGALDLIESRRLDEAERVCLELKKRFPDQIDWIERSATLHVARGQIDQAIEHYEQCLAHIDRYPDGFDSDSRAWYRDQIDRLLRQSKRVGSE
jgi:tetratricopeptide (TPR) repeat protein